MCFSAEASFVGAAVIGATGVASVAVVRDRRDVPLAALPLLFAGHQALEGVTWLELEEETQASLSGWGVHAWVFFAWALLPVYVPWAVRMTERDPHRRRAMLVLVVVGGVVSLVMLTQVLQPEIVVAVVGDNLDYEMDVPFPAWWLAVPYVAATCLAPALSRSPWIVAFGVANFAAMVAAAAIEARDYSSLWCTFAAFLSILVLGYTISRARSRGTMTGEQPSEAVRPARGVAFDG